MKPRLPCGEYVIIRSVFMSFLIPASCPQAQADSVTVGCLPSYKKVSESVCSFRWLLKARWLWSCRGGRQCFSPGVLRGLASMDIPQSAGLPLMGLRVLHTFLTFTSNVAVNSCVQAFAWICISFFLGLSSHRRGVAGSMVGVCLTSIRNKQFYRVVVSLRSCQQGRRFQLLHTLAALGGAGLLHLSLFPQLCPGARWLCCWEAFHVPFVIRTCSSVTSLLK